MRLDISFRYFCLFFEAMAQLSKRGLIVNNKEAEG